MVSIGTLASEDFEADASIDKIMRRVDQMAQVTAESVKFPHQESVALPGYLQTRSQVWAIVLLAGGMVLVKVVRLDAGSQKPIPLKTSALRPVRLPDPHVPDKPMSFICSNT